MSNTSVSRRVPAGGWRLAAGGRQQRRRQLQGPGRRLKLIRGSIAMSRGPVIPRKAPQRTACSENGLGRQVQPATHLLAVQSLLLAPAEPSSCLPRQGQSHLRNYRLPCAPSSPCRGVEPAVGAVLIAAQEDRWECLQGLTAAGTAAERIQNSACSIGALTATAACPKHG